VHVQFTPNLGAPETCHALIQPATRRVMLASDDGSSWPGAAVGTSAVLQNSFCTLRAQGSSMSVSGVYFYLGLDVEFAASWTGQREIQARAIDSRQLDSGWVRLGAYRVGASMGVAPGQLSVSPAGGSGGGAVFQFTGTDADGAQDLVNFFLLINGSHSRQQGCLVLVDRTYSAFYLASDSGTQWSGATAGSAGTLQNSQCVLKAATSTISVSGSQLIVRLDLTFRASFVGSKSVWGYALDQAGLAGPPFAYLTSYNVTSGIP
jgi:hypothetical protein